MIKVTCEIGDYSQPRNPNIKIHSHWNNNSLIELEVEGVRYAVDGKELKRTIDNCMNTGF